MVRKTKTSQSASENSSDASNSEKKTFIVLSLPMIFLFNILKTLLFELFIVLKFVYTSSSRILSKPSNQEEVNLEAVKGDENMDLLQLQKAHHKKAFEFISQALKIDETQNPGAYVLIHEPIRRNWML